MNNKWYTLTRPAVVQFNPPRDNGPFLPDCPHVTHSVQIQIMELDRNSR